MEVKKSFGGRRLEQPLRQYGRQFSWLFTGVALMLVVSAVSVCFKANACRHLASLVACITIIPEKLLNLVTAIGSGSRVKRKQWK